MKTLRIWLIEDEEDRLASRQPALEPFFRKLSLTADSGLVLTGVSSLTGNALECIKQSRPDALVFGPIGAERALKKRDLLTALSWPALVVASLETLDAWRKLAICQAVLLVPTCDKDEHLLTALWSLQLVLGHQKTLADQLQKLQTRLSNRIIVERAKGILMEQFRISEEEAYRRLRNHARRLRKQISDVAQSLLESHYLIQSNGRLDTSNAEGAPKEGSKVDASEEPPCKP
ncbi:MAG: hypothetical protein C4297_02985 [Gemmataceae bacterium]